MLEVFDDGYLGLLLRFLQGKEWQGKGRRETEREILNKTLEVVEEGRK